MTTTPPGAREELEEAEATGIRRRLIWAVVAVFCIGTFGMWIFLLFVYDPGLLIDELPDPTFATHAEEVCAPVMEQIEALPRAETATDPVVRAEVIDTANVALAAMVVDLRSLAPTGPPDSAEAVNEWLDDWEGHVADRQRYSNGLRLDRETRFTESPKGEKQLSRAIDAFAQVNRMFSCETPGDVG